MNKIKFLLQNKHIIRKKHNTAKKVCDELNYLDPEEEQDKNRRLEFKESLFENVIYFYEIAAILPAYKVNGSRNSHDFRKCFFKQMHLDGTLTNINDYYNHFNLSVLLEKYGTWIVHSIELPTEQNAKYIIIKLIDTEELLNYEP